MGWLDRSPYRFGTPFAQDLGPIDPRTGLPAQPQVQQNPYAPPVAPRAPTAMPPVRPMGPSWTPAPIRQMGPPSTPQAPDMGLSPVGPSDASFAAYNPSAAQKPDPQPQPGDQASGTGSAGQPGQDKSQYALGGMLGNINDSDLLTLGLSLLGQSQNGGDWGVVAKDLQGLQQGAMSREDRQREIDRQKEADAREREQFDAWRKEQQKAAGLTQRYEEALKDPTLDADARRMLGIVGPEGYGQYEMWRAEQLARSKEAETSRTHDTQERAKDRAASAEEARIRSANENSIGKYFQAMDAETIGKSNEAAAQIQSRGLPMLAAVKADIQKAKDLGLQRGFFDANQKITMNRMFGENGPLATTLETWRARVLGPALETLRGLGAMSEREMEAAVNSFSNPDMTYDAAMSLLDERIKLAENKLLENKTMNNFFTDAKGLTGKRNAAGQDWNTALTLAFEEDRKAREAKAGPTPQPTMSDMAPAQGGIPANAITLLKQNPTNEMRRMFDTKYGIGSSDRVLGLAQPGGYRGR